MRDQLPDLLFCPRIRLESENLGLIRSHGSRLEGARRKRVQTGFLPEVDLDGEEERERENRREREQEEREIRRRKIKRARKRRDRRRRR